MVTGNLLGLVVVVVVVVVTTVVVVELAQLRSLSSREVLLNGSVRHPSVLLSVRSSIKH